MPCPSPTLVWTSRGENQLPYRPQLGRIKQVDLCLEKPRVCSGLQSTNVLIFYFCMTNCHKFSSLTQHHLLSHGLLGSEVWAVWSLLKAQSRCLWLASLPELKLLAQAHVSVAESSFGGAGVRSPFPCQLWAGPSPLLQTAWTPYHAALRPQSQRWRISFAPDPLSLLDSLSSGRAQSLLRAHLIRSYVLVNVPKMYLTLLK